MRLTIILLLVLFGVVSTQAQQKIAVRVYQNTDNFLKTYDDDASHRSTNFMRLSLAVDIINRKNWIHELELSIPEIRKHPDNVKFPFNYEFAQRAVYKSNVSTYAFRYELMRELTKAGRTMSFKLGAAANPYYIDIGSSSMDADWFSIYRKFVGMSFSIVPRISVAVHKRFAIDLSIPYQIYDLHKEILHIDNPQIPIKYQTLGVMAYSFFPTYYTVRVGAVFFPGR